MDTKKVVISGFAGPKPVPRPKVNVCMRARPKRRMHEPVNIYVSKEAYEDIMSWGSKVEQRSCCMCDKPMISAVGTWDTRQPHGGGEIQLRFGFGSCKYDLEMGTTKFWALICDDCASKFVRKMIRDSEVELDEDGKQVSNIAETNEQWKKIIEGSNEQA